MHINVTLNVTLDVTPPIYSHAYAYKCDIECDIGGDIMDYDTAPLSHWDLPVSRTPSLASVFSVTVDGDERKNRYICTYLHGFNYINACLITLDAEAGLRVNNANKKHTK